MDIPDGQTPAGRPDKSRARKSARRVCILVTGMHRSGTSAFARVLSLLGCDLPMSVVQAPASNETESWQSDAVRQLNDRILASAGSRWADWLEFNPGWLQSPRAEEFREEALALLRKEFGSSRLFVLEDPRMCRLVPFWLGVLEEAGAQPLIISPVRNPLEVAASLEEHDGFEAGLGHLLWLRHVLDAEFASRGTERFFTSYDRMAAGWARTAANAESTLGIAWPRVSEKAAAEIEAFLSDNNPRYQQPVEAALDNPTLSDWLRGSFEIFARWSAAGENPQDFAALDRIRTAFNTAAPAFSRLLSAEDNKVSRLETELGRERQRVGESEQQIGQLKSELESRAGAAQKAEQALAETLSKLAAAEKATAAEQENATRLQTELSRERQRVGETEKQIAGLKSELESRTDAARAAEQELADASTRLAAAEAATAAEHDRASRLEQELSSERRRLGEAEQQVSRLKGELESRTHAAEEAERALMELRHQLAQTESALAQRRHEAEETAGELAVAREDLRKTADARDAAEKVSAGLKEHVVLLMADLKERQAAFAAEQQSRATESAETDKAVHVMSKQVKQVLAVLETSRHEMTSRLSEAERVLKQQADEIETLRRLVEEKEAGAHHERARAEQLRQAAAGEIGSAVTQLLNGRSGLFPWTPFRLRRQVALLKGSGLFDAEWYLREYTDVAEAGIDPLRHYIEFGAKEGRAPNPALTKLNGKA